MQTSIISYNQVLYVMKQFLTNIQLLFKYSANPFLKPKYFVVNPLKIVWNASTLG